MTIDRRIPPPFPNTPDYINHAPKALEYISQTGKTLPKELVSPRYRDYPPLEMFSFAQSPINQDGTPNQQQPIPTPRSRPGFLRRADSLVSSTELALFRRVHEAQQEALQEAQYRHQVQNQLPVLSVVCLVLHFYFNRRSVDFGATKALLISNFVKMRPVKMLMGILVWGNGNKALSVIAPYGGCAASL